MHHPPPPAEENRQLLLKVLGMYDAPAFARRARRIEDADRLLAEHLRRKRAEYLWMVSLRLGQLRALAGDWQELAPLFDRPEALEALRRLHVDTPSMRPSFLDSMQQQDVKRGLFVLRFVFQVAWIA